MTSYGNTKKTYRVEKIDFDRSPSSTFELGIEKKVISFAEYYDSRYSTRIKDLN